MSISYFAIPTKDVDTLGSFIEEDGGDAPSLDAEAMRAALQSAGLNGDADAMKWERGKGYIYVSMGRSHVEVTPGSHGPDDMMDVRMDVMSALTERGLHIWDPQQGKWFSS
jgi:hypothetical protein